MTTKICRPDDQSCQPFLRAEEHKKATSEMSSSISENETKSILPESGIVEYIRKKAALLQNPFLAMPGTGSPPETQPQTRPSLECQADTQPGKPEGVGSADVFRHLIDGAEAGISSGNTEKPTYQKKTFKYLKKISGTVNAFSDMYGVPSDAVAGAIGDEYDHRGVKDKAQDTSISTLGFGYPVLAPASAEDIWKQQLKWAQERSYDPFVKSERLGKLDKLSNPIAWDIGPGNFNVMTAVSLVKSNKTLHASLVKSGVISDADSPEEQASKISKHLLTDRGTVEFTAAQMQETNKRFKQAQYQGVGNSSGLDFGSEENDPERYNANLIASYKEGPSFLERAIANNSLRNSDDAEMSSSYKVNGWPEYLKNKNAIHRSISGE